MNKTKKKIILSAIELYNKHGLTNVKNQDIAKHSGNSLSNFNYHFKTKQDLVYAIIEHMKQVLESKVYGDQLLIKKGQGLLITRSFFEFERDFRFFYMDTFNIVRKYPDIKKDLKIQIKSTIQVIKNLNYISIGMGLMKPEPPDSPGVYDFLAEQIWMNTHFWPARMDLLEIEDDFVIRGLKSSFLIIHPYLTEKGIQAYNSFIEKLENEKKNN